MLRCMGCMAEMDAGTTACPHCGYMRGTPPREAHHLAPETILQGRYVVGRVLGYGGFGVTYMGYDAALERAVAIKEFLPSTFATRIPGSTAVTVYEGNATSQFTAGLTRFVEEAQTLAQFNGVAGIVDIYDSFAGNETAYIVMQLLRGQDVKAVLSASGPLPYETAREIILAVCDTLTAVHAKGIIHRDISPDNIYITKSNEIKLLDFGAARYESAVNSKSLSVILKSGYAPEEQYRSRGEQGPWTDVYALAATFYKMITGVTPPDSMERAIDDAIKEPSKLGAQLPQSAENAILNALCVRKAQRTPTAAAFKAALLADGVERIKVKKTRAGAARVPIAARIAIGVSACLLLALGLFAASGGFDQPEIVLGGTKLEDTFGTADREGFVTLPQLGGKTEQEAKAMLEELGLTCETVGYVFSDGALEQPIVAEQTPTPGSQVPEGGAVELVLNTGELLDSIERGAIPDMRGRSLEQMQQFYKKSTFSGKGYFRIDFIHSTQEELGKLVSIEKTRDDDYVEYTGWIGAGPDNMNTPVGALRMLYWNDTDLVSVIASGGSLELSESEYNSTLRTVHHILVSTDGGSTWQELEMQRNEGHWGYDNTREDGTRMPRTTALQLGRELSMRHPQLADKDILVRMERRYESTGELVDAMTVDTPFRFTIDQTESVTVESAERLSRQEIKTLYDEGRFGNDRYTVESYLENPEGYTDFVVWRLRGPFDTQANRSFYYMLQGQYQNRDGYLECTQDGELLLQSYGDSMDGVTVPKQKLLLQKNMGNRFKTDENGNSVYVAGKTIEYML